MTRAFLFPGQGAQAVGMGHALAEASPEARYVFEEVDDTLGQHLSRTMWEGPEEHLTLTENAQPALMTVSMAVVRTLEKEAGVPLRERAHYVAGHSLGEYTALCAAGALSLADAATLLRVRGRAMQQAVPVGEGGMAALLGLDLDTVHGVAGQAAGETGGVCRVANDNAPGQVVVSGHKAAVDRAGELAKEKGAKRVQPLAVSAPFHCDLMQPAAETMAESLASAHLDRPVPPVVSNVTADATDDPETIRRRLVDQVTGTVRWRESVETMAANGVANLVELGAGKVLSGLARRIDRNLAATSVETPHDIEELLKSL
mgnify:CR=1 FL=1